MTCGTHRDWCQEGWDGSIPTQTCCCVLPANHETPHVCLCGGGWLRRPDGELVIYEWSGGLDPIRPGENTRDRAMTYARRAPIARRLVTTDRRGSVGDGR